MGRTTEQGLAAMRKLQHQGIKSTNGEGKFFGFSDPEHLITRRNSSLITNDR